MTDAVLTLTCYRMISSQSGERVCGFQQAYPYPSVGDAMTAVAADGWRKTPDQRWHCPSCAAGDTDDDLEDRP